MRPPSPEKLDRRFQQIMDETAKNVESAQTPEKPEQEKKPRISQADRILDLVKSLGITLFRDNFDEPYVRFRVKNHMETWPLKSKKLKTWLSRAFWEREHKTPTANALDSALNVLAGQASFDGEPIELSNRVAEDRGEYWYDLANTDWQAVRITSTEWSIADRPPILFKRYNHQSPQVHPVQGGDVKKLLQFVNLAKPSEQILFLVYVISCFIPNIPHPIAVFYGPQGAAKTTLGRMLRSIVDPSTLATLSMPASSNELVQQLYHHWFPFFDNITYLSELLSDDLCRAVTGAGFSKRVLYSDDDDVIYAFRRPIGLNGINLVVNRPDLLERSMLFQLERIAEDKRREEKKVWEAFNLVKPQILGGIFDALSTAMCLYPTIVIKEKPRMADFAAYGCAIAQALGYTQEEFLQAYRENISAQQEHAIQENLVAYAVVQFMEHRDTWEGKMSELLDGLESIAVDQRLNGYRTGWPNSPNALSRRVNEVKATLMDRNIIITNLKSNGVRKVKIEKITKKTDPVDTTVTDESIKEIFGDDVVIEDAETSTLKSSQPQPQIDQRVDSGDISLPF